ncbi:MAG: helix-turn-helix transcriptional regulator [Stackebrandtia sp.]
MSDVAGTAASALRKVEQMLPKRLRGRVRAISAATETAPEHWPQVTAELLHTIGEAGHRRNLLDFDYRGRTGEPTRRRVEPYRQVLVNRRWYLLAWDRDRQDWRIFRLDRMSAVATIPTEFEVRELPGVDAASYVADAVSDHPARHRVIVDFHAPVERVASLLSERGGLLERLDNATCRYTADVDSYEWLAITLGVTGLRYRIVAPEGFIAYSRDLAARIAEGASTKE